MHDVTPKVVAMAVSTVMAICRIFCQICVFMLVSFSVCFVNVFFFLGTDFTDYTEPVLCLTKPSASLDDADLLILRVIQIIGTIRIH